MTAQAQTAADRRDCALYRFWVRHPVTAARVLGYIGETARMPFQRLMEHIYSQPWADTIIGWEVDPVTYPGKTAVLVAEKAAIEAEKPLYNYEFNLDNPLRIEIWRAVQQRQTREPGWQPPAKGVRVPRPRAERRTAAPARRRPEVGERLELAARLIRWLPVAVLGGWVSVVAASGPVATWYDGLAYGAGVTVTAVGVCLPGSRRRRRSR